MVPGHRSENHSSSSSRWLWQRWTNTQRAGMEDGRGVYQKHKTRQVQAHKQTNRANCGRGWGKAPQDSTIFLFCVVNLGRVPPTRPPFTEPLEEILFFLSPIFDSATLRQLHGTGELDLRCTEKTRIKDFLSNNPTAMTDCLPWKFSFIPKKEIKWGRKMIALMITVTLTQASFWWDLTIITPLCVHIDRV